MSESKPREFWMSKDGDGYYDKNSDYPTMHPDKVIHVIEYSAYEAVVEGRNLENAMSDYVLKAERARNAKMVTEIKKVIDDHDVPHLTGGYSIEGLRKVLAENTDILKERGR